MAVSAVGLGFLSTALASVLCLVVPGRARARDVLLWQSCLRCRRGGPGRGVVSESGSGNRRELAIVALEVLAIVLFILFMRQLARYLEKADDAARVLRSEDLAVAGGVGLFAQFSAMIGSKTFLLARDRAAGLGVRAVSVHAARPGAGRRGPAGAAQPRARWRSSDHRARKRSTGCRAPRVSLRRRGRLAQSSQSPSASRSGV